MSYSKTTVAYADQGTQMKDPLGQAEDVDAEEVDDIKEEEEVEAEAAHPSQD